eukprot:5008254-Pyramimonas_sp.AAC.1
MVPTLGRSCPAPPPRPPSPPHPPIVAAGAAVAAAGAAGAAAGAGGAGAPSGVSLVRSRGPLAPPLIFRALGPVGALTLGVLLNRTWCIPRPFRDALWSFLGV